MKTNDNLKYMTVFDQCKTVSQWTALYPFVHYSALFLCTFFFRISFFSCCTFFNFFLVALFLCCTPFMFHFFHTTPFSCCTFLCVALFLCIELFHVALLDVAIYSFCILLLLNSSHVAMFSCCTLFMLQYFDIL